jgi:hypothetical protein
LRPLPGLEHELAFGRAHEDTAARVSIV